MKRLRNPRTGIDQGDVLVFSDFQEGGEMWTGRGQREKRCTVLFSDSFASTPSVQISVSLWDIDTSVTARAEILAENITKSQFEIVFKTWGDSRIARIRASWLAIGELPYEDDWDDVD
ncbi:H-type lectin domain-containing protein [Epibacterium ulvae]|uniref:H-type lectin domain-containing protein n=1 Tax=Epibacterium ulvae TaxID=1156985 RepID=UPI0024913AFB|nr:H-type lectin domain-containing protein [Epibacterium ulvae]